MILAEPRGSVQLVRYHRARIFGHPRAEAAAYAEIPLAEAELCDRDWAITGHQQEEHNV